jgi:hypothetical protein
MVAVTAWLREMSLVAVMAAGRVDLSVKQMAV